MPDQSELYYETYREDEEELLSPGKRILRTVRRTVGLLLVAAILGVFFWRIWMTKDPSSMTEYLYTDAAVHAATLTVTTQNLDQTYLGEDDSGNPVYIKRSEYYTPGNDYDGCIKVGKVFRTAETGGVQLYLRYNGRVIPSLMREQFGLRYEEDGSYPFVFALMTADGRLVGEYGYTEGSRGYYTFRRLVFEGVPESSVLYLNIYYAGEEYSPDRPFISMVIYDDQLESTALSLPEKRPSTAALQTDPRAGKLGGH